MTYIRANICRQRHSVHILSFIYPTSILKSIWSGKSSVVFVFALVIFPLIECILTLFFISFCSTFSQTLAFQIAGESTEFVNQILGKSISDTFF